MDLQNDGLRTLRDMSLVARQINIFLRKLLEGIQEPMSNFELSVMIEVSRHDMVTVDVHGLNLMTTKSKVSDAVSRLEELRLVRREKEGDSSDLVSLSEDGQVLMACITNSFSEIKDDWLSGLNSPSIALAMSVLLGQNQVN